MVCELLDLKDCPLETRIAILAKCMVRGQLCYEGSILSEILRVLYGILSRFEKTTSMVSASVLGRLFRHRRRKTTILSESCIVQL